MKKMNKFKFPKSVLNQIGECSKGFFLVVVTEDNKFNVFQDLNDPLSYMGMLNFIEVYSTSTQATIRNKTAEALEENGPKLGTEDDEEEET